MMNVPKYLLVLATILVLAVCYYFIIALPAHNREILKFEREKYDATQKEKELRQITETKEKEEAEALVFNCVNAAEARYYEYIKINGTPVPGKKGTYSTPQYVADNALKMKKADIEECYRKYRR